MQTLSLFIVILFILDKKLYFLTIFAQFFNLNFIFPGRYSVQDKGSVQREEPVEETEQQVADHRVRVTPTELEVEKPQTAAELKQAERANADFTVQV